MNKKNTIIARGDRQPDRSRPTFLPVWMLLCSLALAVPGAAQDYGTRDPLFLDDAMLEVTVEAPFTTIVRERRVDEQYPGKLRYTRDDGSVAELDVRVRARGNFRRDPANCRFPPIRLRFRGRDVEDTIFYGLRRVPLVTHCQNTSRYEQGVLREYMTYRILQEVTDLSLAARLLRITYVDTEGRLRDRETLAFAIEHRERLAARSGIPVLEIPQTEIRYLDPEYLNLTSIFQFLIGNTDFSPIRAPEGENCCHNHRLFGVDEGASPQFAVPYDFDMTGMASLPHSQPNPAFNLRNVRQRLYRGRCINNELVPGSIAVFKEKRGTVMRLVDDLPAATSRTKNELRGYINSFYSVIDNPSRLQREIVGRCIPP